MTQPETTQEATTGTTPAGRRRAGTIGLWALQLICVVTFAIAGATKVGGQAEAVEGFDRIGFGDWFRYLIGTLELAAAVGLLIPLLAGLTGLCLTALMVGAVITTIIVEDGDLVAVPAVFLVLCAIIAWGRRRETARLVEVVRTGDWASVRPRRRNA